MDDDTTEMDIFGPIGEWGVSATHVKEILSDVNTSSIIVNVNSPGGDVFDGIAIHNMLRQYRGDVEVRVMGLAASAASVIAMAGDTIRIADGAFIMIHNAWAVAVGDKRAAAKMAETLDQIDGALVQLYAARTGGKERDIADMMNAETWLGAEAAVEAGFADEILENEDKADASAWDVKAYKNAPKPLLARRAKGSQANDASASSVSVADLLAHIGKLETPYAGHAKNGSSRSYSSAGYPS